MFKMQLFLIIILFYLFASCNTSTSPLDSAKKSQLPRTLSSSEQILVNTSQNFGLKLFQSVNELDSSDNIFISPLSVSMALGMTLNGANGQTYEDMKNTLELNGLSEQQINEAYKSLIDLLLNLDEKVIFEIANSIWPKKGYPVLPSFMEVNQTYFYSEAKPLDFARSDAVDIINNWISEKTHGKIENMLDYIPEDAVMYLINAIYFKGTWTYQFDADLTNTENFYTTPQNFNPCQMMKISGNWLYYQDDKIQITDLPYGDSLYSMTVFLPSADQTIDDFVASLNADTWDNYFQDLAYKKGTIMMPKLKLDYKKLLNDMLINMGMGIAFGGSADFSRINGYGNLFISRVIHQSFVQVDEEGTEAAAATIVELRETSGTGPTGFFLRMDRPYIFVIRERTNNTILFIGKISKPQWTE
ncbi:MAG TPA: serpin family protein [Caldithrix sp.]|nr:serpin family protein [Calditrichaceae bacterium]HEM49309.1 serpin family protein [Caldithrix sp.]HES59125.1 serpin family protein [Caldithrix sp.]